MDSWVTPAIAALWALFLATHVCLSSQTLRPRLVRVLGPQAFLGVYSLVALAIFTPLVWIYSTHKHAGAFLWYGSTVAWTRPLMYVGMVLALTLAVGGNLNPSPASLAPGSGQVKGVLRVTRHPLFMGAALLGLLHLAVARIHASDLAFFAGLPIVALLGCWHQDLRKLATDEENFRSFYAETAFFPFARGGWSGIFDPPSALVIGVIGTIALRVFHPALFGGAG